MADAPQSRSALFTCSVYMHAYPVLRGPLKFMTILNSCLCGVGFGQTSWRGRRAGAHLTIGV